MYFSTTCLACLTIIRVCSAFTGLQDEGNLKSDLYERQLGNFGRLVDITGKHAYRAPGEGDLRGPCPGLNAMANHGYIARNGYTNILESTLASFEVFGLAADVAGPLAVLAAVQAGDGNSYSIGGPPSRGLLSSIPLLGPLLGTPGGLSGSHNRFEHDSSLTRQDSYLPGDNVNLDLDVFGDLLRRAPSGVYTLETLGEHLSSRLSYSIANNPYFFRGPGPLGPVLPEGTAAFVVRLMSNKSAEHPGGLLDAATLMSLYGVSRTTGGQLAYSSGNERIPENWYTFPTISPYNLATFALDVAAIYAQNPDQVAFGGNFGQVNTFTGIDLEDLTGGVFNAAMLLEGNNAVCLSLQTTSFLLPDVVRNGGVIGNVTAAVARVVSRISPLLDVLSCPRIRVVRKELLDVYPGWRRSL